MVSTVKAGLTTNAMLKSIKRRAMVPDNQNTFSDQDFIDIMNEEMMIGIVPTVLKTKEEYFVFRQLSPLLPSKNNYPVPERALASKLREVCFRDNTSKTVGSEFEMTQIAIDDRYSNLANGVGTADFTGYRRFYMYGSDLIVHPGVGTNPYGAIAFYFYLRPNTIVKESLVATITNIDRTTGDITLSSIPTGYTTSQTYDFVKARSPHNIIDIEISINSLNTTSKIVNVTPADISLDLDVGDYLPLAGQTCIPNVPTEMHMILAQRVAQRTLEALGDTEGLNNASVKIAEMEDRISTMMENRVEGAPRKVVNRALMTGTARNKRK